ncbi:MAG TPA: ring-cleaving dioxygenase [Chthoniobacterales bacterium]|nr:ring-cleaving dioxygenase [Chthoniobacterales bacterium]
MSDAILDRGLAETIYNSSMKLRGIHHITAIASDPQRNVDFYTQVLGLRFAKRTVNFDDPSTYHLYYGDQTGRPGTAITFFAWPGARRGTHGTGQVIAASFAVPQNSIDYWKARFDEHHVFHEQLPARFDQSAVRLTDPDGLILELIEAEQLDDVDLKYETEVPTKFAIHGFHAASLEVQRAKNTEGVLALLGFELIGESASRKRFSVNPKSTSAGVDLIERPDGQFGLNSAGTVHHIAFCCADDLEQVHWREQIVARGLHVTPVIDRFYFHSIYFREPGGILFEIATANPGFTVDEPVQRLGETLKLPPQYEEQRPEIERVLPPILLGPNVKNMG